MSKTWFVSRHEPTLAQLALVPGLIKVPDINAFDRLAVDTLLSQMGKNDVDRVIVVNAALALNIAALAAEREQFLCIGVFENANRAPEGEKPTFEASALHWWYVEYGVTGWTIER